MATYLPFVSADRQTVLGHYGVAQLSGAIAATPTALDPHASVRWSDTMSANGRYFVLLRLKVGWHCISAITTAVRMSYQASIVRGFSVDFTTAATASNMAVPAKTGCMRGTMNNSLMGTAGPRICTTAPQSGHTYTLDDKPFAITTWTVPGILTGTVSTAAGVAGPMQTLFEATAFGQHPVVLGSNEGVVVQLTHTGWATGTVSLVTQWEWAEVLAF